MAWTTPLTAVANTVFTSAQFNTYVRDNLNATETGLVSAAGQILRASGTRALQALTPAGATVLTSETLTNITTPSNLTTNGPAVTVTTGTSALVHIACEMNTNTQDVRSAMTFYVTGASTLTNADHPCELWWDGTNRRATTNNNIGCGSWTHLTTLTPGSNTFTAKYWVSSTSIGTWANRHIIVIPL